MKFCLCFFVPLLFGSTGRAQFYKVSLVKDINPGAAHSYPTHLINCNGQLYFSADNGTSGLELWKSNGTGAGTSMVMDINGGTASSGPQQLTAIKFNVFFYANDGTHGGELWRHQTAGAGAGTYLVKDINPNGSTGSSLTNFVNANDTLAFVGNNGSGNQIWRSTGSAAQTIALTSEPSGTTFQNLTPSPSSVFYTKGYGCAPTREININTGNVINYGNNSDGCWFTNSGNNFFLSWYSGGAPGTELYKVVNGVLVLVKDVYTGPLGSSPEMLTDANGVLFFVAETATGKSLWKSNGTEAGTVIVKSIPGSEDFSNFCNVDGTLYFTVTSTANGNELWKSDGTTAGTVLVKDIVVGTGNSSPGNFINFNGILYFSADDGIHGRELWRSDGTDAGTYIVSDINDGIASSNPAGFAVADNELFFSADDGSHGKELWKVKNCAAVAIATASSASITQDVINPNFYNGENCNNLIATIKQNGVAINGSVTAKLWNETIQPLDYVKRHYQILPVSAPVESTARVTLYFTDAEFAAFNTQATPPALLLPVSTGTAAEITKRKSNLHIEKRGGSSSNGSGLPVTYSGVVQTFDPPQYDIVWNIAENRWEISFFSNGFGGYFVKTRTSAIATTYTFTGSGNWSEPTNWEYGAVPPADLSSGSQIIVNPATGSCILNVPYTVKPNVKLTVYPGKKLDVQGNLSINKQIMNSIKF